MAKIVGGILFFWDLMSRLIPKSPVFLSMNCFFLNSSAQGTDSLSVKQKRLKLPLLLWLKREELQTDEDL